MKKFIYIFGIILLNIFAFGAIFKIMHWPGAGILISFGLGAFAVIFLPLAFFNNYRGAGRKNLSLYIAGFICSVICIIGAIFKIQHWPGAGIFLLIGVPLPFIYFLPVYLYHQKKEKEKSVLNFLGVMFLMLYISVFSAFLAMNVSKDIITSLVVGTDNLSKTTELYNLKNKLTYQKLDFVKANDDKAKIIELKMKTAEISNKINAVKLEIVQFVDAVETPAYEGINNINFFAIKNKIESNLTSTIMRGDEVISGRAAEIKFLVNNYKEFLKTLVKNNNERLKHIDNLLNTSDVTDTAWGEKQTRSWEDLFFQKGAYAIIILGNLECIETNVKMAEAEVLSQIPY